MTRHRRPQLVIFDCDGVLVDSERLAVRVESAALAELGWKLTEAEIAERFLGRTDGDLIAAVEAHLGRSAPPGWRAALQQRYREVFATELIAVDGIEDALDRITLPTCVASSSSHAKLRTTLGLTGLYDRFAGRIFSADDVQRGKPAPDLFLLAAERCDTRARDCIVIEDSIAGVRAARAAGMRVLGYAGGLTSEIALAEAGATTFASMQELPERLDAR